MIQGASVAVRTLCAAANSIISGFALSPSMKCLMVLIRDDMFIEEFGLFKCILSSTVRPHAMKRKRMSNLAKSRVTHLKRKQIVVTFLKTLVHNLKSKEPGP